MKEDSIIYNRLKKNRKKLTKLVKNEETDAFRLYEKDIPEYPYIIDIYGEHVVIYEKGKKLDFSDDFEKSKHLEHKNQIIEAIIKLLSIPRENIVIKSRLVQKGKHQYNKLNSAKDIITVKENSMLFNINPYDYLDTGLFLDHRPLRKIVKKSSNNLKVLNLFSYTGSISVAAALGGGTVTTVDMSKTYIEWSKENFKKNNISIEKHQFIQADVLQYIPTLKETFDIIILDPPSFSNSKRMDEDFNVQDYHGKLINKLMNHLSKTGTLYFSNNFTKFKLDENLPTDYQVEDISFKSIPDDFRNKKIHKCYKITHK